MRLRWIGFILIILAVLMLAGVVYANSHRKDVPLDFSTTTLLNSTWQNYKKEYLEPGDFRTLDPSRANITTSEGQSYTMLRAVWMSDKTTFDEENQWTKNNLKHSTDNLFAWEFGKRADGSYGILTDQGGSGSASDADTDIALSLVLAYSRWETPQYLDDARNIIRDIWDKEVVTINGIPYLAADNYEKDSNSPTILVNPSYFSPYAYRIFAQVDPSHPWNKLVDSSYAVLKQSIALKLDGASSAGLPPDWIAINRTTGAITAPATATASSATTLTTNFGYDALRVPFRLALDYAWYQDPRDKEILSSMNFLATTYNAGGRLNATYTHMGSTTQAYDYESASMYGGTIGYFKVVNPALAASVYNDKLLYLFNPNNNAWKQELSYYDDNWAWFGIALYTNHLPNLTASVSAHSLLTK